MSLKKTLANLNRDGGYFWGVATGLVLALLVFKIIPFIGKSAGISLQSPVVLRRQAAPAADEPGQTAEVPAGVIPESYTLGVSLGDVVTKMVSDGVIDKDKFQALYAERGGLKPEEKALLEKAQEGKLVVTAENAPLILNLLWPLGIANRTAVLGEGPIGTEYKDNVGQFASTGGWTLGKEDGGKLFNRFDLVKLTPDQEATVKELASNIYRPCCGNSTYFPDCNHGAAMLGFLELAVAQGMSREQIYKDALVLNSYWFPQTYSELAIYFSKKKNMSWDKVSPQEALGQTYSSGQGYQAVNKELQSDGLLPKVQGGGGCGV